MRRIIRIASAGLALSLISTAEAEAGGPFRRQARGHGPVPVSATATRPEDRVAPTGMLGSFVPANYIFVRGNGVVGGGYSPLGSFGQNSMDLFGPISSLREIAAPVVHYTRGYDGRVVPVEGTSFSTPFLPGQTRVIYPTRATNYAAPRGPGIPVRTGSGINWVDQN